VCGATAANVDTSKEPLLCANEDWVRGWIYDFDSKIG